jgi:hypothetical protein
VYRGVSGCAPSSKSTFLSPLSDLAGNITRGLSGELGLGTTETSSLQDLVPLPLFLFQSGDSATKNEDDLFVGYHFLAHVTLRTLINRIHDSLQISGKY